MAMPDPGDEIALIEAFANTKVIGVTLNHEGMTDAGLTAAIEAHSLTLGLPVSDALSRPAAHLAELVLAAYPQLRRVTVAATL